MKQEQEQQPRQYRISVALTVLLSPTNPTGCGPTRNDPPSETSQRVVVSRVVHLGTSAQPKRRHVGRLGRFDRLFGAASYASDRTPHWKLVHHELEVIIVIDRLLQLLLLDRRELRAATPEREAIRAKPPGDSPHLLHRGRRGRMFYKKIKDSGLRSAFRILRKLLAVWAVPKFSCGVKITLSLQSVVVLTSICRAPPPGAGVSTLRLQWRRRPAAAETDREAKGRPRNGSEHATKETTCRRIRQG